MIVGIFADKEYEKILAVTLDKAKEVINNKKKLLQSANEQWEERSVRKSKAQEYLNQLIFLVQL